MRWCLPGKSRERTSIVVFSILLVAMVFALTCKDATASIRFTEIGRWGGACAAVSVAHGRAYIGCGSSVLIYDVSNTASPAKVGAFNVPTSSSIASICISGNYAYVLAYEAGLFVVNISNPANPTIVGSCSTNAYARAVAVSGNYAYIADSNGGLKIVNVSYPAHPTQVGSFAINGYCYGLAVSGNYVYLTDYTGLLVINVSNPTSPTKAGVLSGVYANDIAISGNRLYTASGVTNGFQIFDISSPASPVRLGLYDTPGEALGVAVSGSTAYVGDSKSGLQIINVSNPASPTLIGTFDTNDSCGKLAISGNQILTADCWDGMRAINVSNPAYPTEAWACASGNVGGVAVSGNTIFAACYEDISSKVYALNTLDTSDPSNIVQTGSCSIPGSGSVDLSGSSAWIAGYNGLHIADVTTPASPSLLGTYTTPTYAKDVALFDHYACVADDNYGIQVVDIANPASPVKVGSYITSGYANAVAMSGNYAYVAYGSSGLLVISLENPASPTLVARYPTSSDAYDVKISGHNAYLNAAGLQILDITNPAAPTLVSRVNYAPAGSITQSGSYLYLSGTIGTSSTTMILDVSDLTNPVVVGGIPSSGYCTVSGDRLYLVKSGILKVFQMTQSSQCIIYGYVKDPSGKPIYGATVSTTAGGYSATTDPNGRYELDYVDPATYTITASGSGWAPTSTTATAADGRTVQAPDIVLAFGAIAGCVKDNLGNPVSGATISITNSPYTSTTTDADGNYTLSNLAPYNHLTASKPGHVSVSQAVSVSGGQTTTCNLTLVRTGSITGFVKDNLGRPISQISVSACSYGAGTTDSSGAYLITNVTPGTYSFVVSDTSWTPVVKSNVIVVSGETVTVDFTLQLGTISGTVKNRAGNPVSGATISSSNGDLSATSDSNGTFTIENVGPTYSDSKRGPTYYELTASKAGYQSIKSNVHVTGGITTNTSFVLTGNGSISGTITNSAGKPISGAQVTTTYSCRTYTTTTDSTGHYSIPDAYPATDINLVASKTNYGTVMKKINVIDCEETVCNFRMADAIALDLVSSAGIDSHLNTIAVANGIAAVNGNRLHFVDVSNPANPVYLTRFGSSLDTVIFGNYAYIASDITGLRILNISNPSTPSLIGTYDTTGNARAVDLDSHYAYVADNLSCLQIIDISNPNNPLRVGGYDTGGNACGVDVVGSYAYVADGGGGLQIIDIHNPGTPTQVGHYSLPNCSFCDVTVSGKYAYVIDDYLNLFQVIDVSVPATPTLIGTGYTAYSRPRGIAISGNYAYVSAGYYGGVMVYNITRPTDPGLVAQYRNYLANDIAISSGFVYAAGYNGSLIILAPCYLKVGAITPQQTANFESALPVSLYGYGFKEGATVKLTHPGQADINATEVSVVDPGYITCKLNLTGAAPGLWSIMITNTDGISSSLRDGFAITLPDSAPLVGSNNRCIKDTVTATACSKWRFKLFGRVTETATGSFVIDDGSGVTIKVYALDCNRVKVKDYVAVTGTLDASPTPAVLITTNAQVDILATTQIDPPPPPMF